MDKELESYRDQLASNPADAEAFARLEAALLKAQDWDGLVALTEDRSAGLEPEEQQAAWLRLADGLEAFAAELDDAAAVSRVALVSGRIREHQLDAVDDAMLRYQQAFQIDSNNLEALAEARRIYVEADRWEMVLQLYNVELSATAAAPRQAELYFRMADICNERLSRPTDAVACVRQALKLQPDHPLAAEYGALLDDARRDRRVQVEEIISNAEATRDPRKRSALMTDAASLWFEEAPTDPEIERLLKEVLARDPRSEHARILLEQFYEANDEWDALVAWLTRRAESTARKADRIAIYQRLATVCLEALDDEEEAVAWHRKVLELNPVERAALNFCVDYYSQTEAWEALVEVYVAAVRVRRKGGDEAAMLVQIAMILWRKLEDLDGAESYFRRIKLNDPKNRLMLTFYTEYYRERRDFKRLLAVLGTRQTGANDLEEKMEIGLEMARVAEEDLQNLQKAIDIWKTQIKLQRDHPGGRAALRRLYTETGKWNALLEFLKEDLQLTEGTPARLEIFRQLIAIYRDRMKLPRMVVNTWNEVLAEDPGNGEALDALEAIYEGRSKWNDLIGVLERRAEAAADAEDQTAQVGHLRRIAGLWLEKFSNPSKAREALEGILAIDAKDIAAIGQLVEIYKRRKDWRALYATYRRQLPLLEGTERTDLLVEMANIAAERLDTPAEAVVLWRQVLGADPERDEARDALEDLLLRQRAWSNLVTLYRERTQRCEGAAQLPWLRKLGRIHSEHMDDVDAAAEIWQTVLAIDPQDAEAERYLRELHLSRSDWTALETLYGERDDHATLVQLLHRAVDEAEDSDTRVALLRRLARITGEVQEDAGAAVAAWERILVEEPSNAEAAARLAPHYARIGAWEQRAQALEVLLGAGDDEPVALMVELARVHEDRRGDSAAAWPWRARALEAAPERDDLLAAAEATAQGAGVEAELAELLTGLLDRAPDEARRQALRRVLARQYAEALGRPEEAALVYEEIREAQPADPEALGALESLYKRMQSWDDLLTVYDQRLENTDKPAEQSAILAAVGELHETVRGDRVAAQSAYERLRALDEENVEALRGLQRIARTSDDPGALAGYLSAELDLATDVAERADLRYRLGSLAEEGGDAAAALPEYAQALEARADHPQALEALHRLLDDEAVGAQAGRTLEPHLRRLEDWTALRRVIGLQIEDVDDPQARAALLREAAEIEEQRLGDARAAFGSWRRLLELRPGDADVQAQLERLAAELNTWPALADHYARFAVGGDLAVNDPEAALGYCRRLASVQEERLGRAADARATLETLLAEQGDDLETLVALDRLTTRLEDWRALVRICERRLALLADDEERRTLLFRMGDLLEEVLDAPEEAVEVHRRVLETHPEDERALNALERIYVRLERWEELGVLLEARLDAVEGAASVPVAMQLASLLEGALNSPAGALELYAAVLEVDPEHHAAASAAEALIIEHDEDTPAHRSIRLRACDVLEPVYDLREDWQSAIRLLQTRLADETEPQQRAAQSVRIARLYEGPAGDLRAAFASYGGAFAEVFGDAEIFAALERLAEQLDAWAELVSYLESGLDGEAGEALAPDARREGLRRAALLSDARVGSPEDAIRFNVRLLDHDAHDAEALARLDDLYGRTDQPEALAGVLERRMAIAETMVDRKALGYRLGALYEERLSDAAGAVGVYERIKSDVDPEDIGAHEALERLYAASENHEALCGVLVDHADLVDDVEKRALLLRAADVQEIALERPDGAVDLYRQVLAIDEADGEALGQLDRLLASLDRAPELLEVLDAERALAEEPDVGAQLDLRRGLLLRDALGDPEGAVTAFAAVLAHQPENVEARAALTSMLDDPEVSGRVTPILAERHEADGDWEALRDVLRQTLDGRDDVADQVRTLERIARIEEQRLADADAAFGALSEAWRRDEADPRLEPELERLAEVAGEAQGLADLYAEMVPVAADRAETLHLRIATIAEEQLQDPARAVRHLREVQLLDPENEAALAGLERLLARLGDHGALVDVLESKVEAASDEAARKPLLLRMAEIQESVLDDGGAAVETWRRILADDEQDPDALANLERLLGHQERWAEASALLEHRAGVESEDAARAEVEYRLARVLEQHLGEGERALDLYRGILEAVPGHPATEQALGALFGEPERADGLGISRPAVARALEPIYREGDAPQALVDVLEVLEDAADGEPSEQARLLEEIATVRGGRLADAEGAFAARGRLLRVAPEDAANRAELERLAADAWRWDPLATLYEETAADAIDPVLKIDLLLALAKIEESHRGQDGRAAAVYRDVLALDPENTPAIDGLVELYGRTAAWDDLVQLYLDRAEVASAVADQKGLLFKACQILEEVVADTDRAIETYRRVLEVDPEDERAREALRRFFTRDGRWQELTDLLRDEIELTSQPGARAAIRYQLGEVHETRLDDLDGAIAAWNAVLEDDEPGHAGTVEALERLLIELDDQGQDPRRRKVAMILEPIYAQAEQWSDWIVALRVRLDFEEDTWQRVETLGAIARAHEQKLEDRGGAFEAWSQAFAEDFGNPDIRLELARLAGELGAWKALTDAYLAGIDAGGDADAAVDLLGEVGRVRETRLQDREGAIEAYRRVRALDETNTAALDALQRLLEATGDHAGLVEVLAVQAELSDEPDARRTLRARIGQLQEDVLDDPAAATEAWRRVFEEEPEDAEAIDALVRLYTRSEDWSLLVGILRERLELCTDDAARKGVLAQIATTQEAKLEDIDEAILTWRSVRDLDPRDADGLAALDRLLTAQARWGELIDLLEGEREAVIATDPARGSAIELRIATILADELQRVEQAIEMYGEMLGRTPEVPEARAALEALLEVPEHRFAACRVLEPYFEQRDAHSALARIFELQLHDLGDPLERLELLKRLGALQRDVLSNGRGAFDTFGQALAEDPSDPDALSALEALTTDLGLHPELAHLLEARVAEANDPRTAVDLQRRRARLYDDQLEVPVKAVEAWQAVLEQEPMDREALAALDRLYQAQEDWPALIEILRRRVEEGTAENLADLRCKLGYLLEAVDGDTEGAIELYRAVLWDDPGHADALAIMERLAGALEHRQAVAEVLDPLYRDAEEWLKLALLTEMRIELSEDSIQRAMLWGQSAEIREEQLDDPASAFEAALQAFAETPDDIDARGRLLRLGEQLEVWPRLAAAFDAVLDRVHDTELQLADHQRLAEWSQTRLEDPARAIVHHRAVLEIDPGHAPTLDALEALLRGQSDWSALADVLAQRAELVFELDEKRRRLMELGTLRDARLGDPAGAARAWLEVLEIDDGDATALDALEGLHEREGDWGSLVEILGRRAETTYDEEALVRIHERLGALALTELADPQRAADAYERVLEIKPEQAGAIEQLTAIYRQSERWDRLQEVLLKSLAAADEDAEARADALVALALNAEAQLDRPDSALDYYRQALSLRPGDEAIMGQLEALYRDAERWYELVEAWREHLVPVRAEGDQDEVVGLLVKIAEVAQGQLMDADLAIECLTEVLELDPAHGPARLVLADLHERSGDWEKAATALEAVAAETADADDRAAAWRRLGLLYRDRLDRADDARGAFEQAVELSGDAEAVEALIAMARAAGSHEQLAELLVRRLEAVTGADRVPVLRELATVREAAGDVEGRIAALEEAQRLQPEELSITDDLLDALFAADRHADAEPILQAVVVRLKEGRRFRDLFRYNYRLGCAAEARGDEDAALAAYTACFEFDATYLPNLLRLGKLHYRQESWKQALRIFQTALLHQMKLERPDRADLFFHLGKVRLAQGEPRKARDMFNRALAQVPGHAPSREALDAL